jgi:hypothetical protein
MVVWLNMNYFHKFVVSAGQYSHAITVGIVGQ